MSAEAAAQPTPPDADASPELRAALLDTMRAMGAAHLNVGTAGNASVRLPPPACMLITPSGLPAERSRPEDMAVVGTDGNWHGLFAPSSEWQLHRDIYAAFPDAGAILHAHAPFATALACQRIDIPPFHYMIARFGGSTVRCARYATFGTQALSDAGADVVQMSEPSASTDLLSPDMFDEYAGYYMGDSLASVKGATGVLHICGNTTDILNNMINVGVKALSIEEKVVPEEGVKIVNKRAALIGNIGVVNPLLQGTPADCAAHAKRCAAAGFDVISPGCGLSALIADENLAAIVKAIKG